MKYFCFILIVSSFAYPDIPVPPLTNAEITVPNAKIDVLRGMISADRRLNSFLFTPSRDGLYRFEITELKQNVRVNVAAFDSAGEIIASAAGVGRQNGATLNGLTAGKTYRIQVGQHTGFSAYTLIIGHQKEPADTSAATDINDSMQYTDQRNVYLFTAPLDGNYRFEVGNLKNMRVNIGAFNAEGESLRYITGVGNGHGLTLKGLSAGEMCEIHVGQHTGFGTYTFIIGRQKEPVDIGLDIIADSMQYTDQQNVYLFTAPSDGRYRFELSHLPEAMRISLYAFDRAGSLLQYTAGVGPGRGIALSGLSAGELYQIHVRQYSGLGKYTLLITKQ
ncbi:MAG: hypothetical protein LBG90_03700 [Spirochaetaceae bacterium]|jgi:hypothetical protein|nr:hypothetical protein [Spirochaetaceae bacterium]